MTFGFLTDVHGDLEALRRALQSLEGVDRIVCLGDVAGGPSVPECIELLRPHLAVCGNHDRWDFELMGLPENARQYLVGLPVTLEEADFVAVHSDFERSGDEVFYFYVHSEFECRRLLDKLPHRLIFVGHTHLAQVHELNGQELGFFKARDRPAFDLSADRYVINVGAAPECTAVYDTEANRVAFNFFT